jgi:hypothetical protein
MDKLCTFPGESEHGPTVIPLFNSATDAYFEKTASSTLLPDVVKYIESLRPRNDAVYNLVNAMGAGEYFGSNINGDYFSEASLIHAPDDWTGNPLVDKIKAKEWGYGYPTFYFAHPYAHHRNKDATRAFGEVELAVWHPRMKRVELVTRVEKDKCEKYGGVQVWDKLKAGMFPDVSMGAKVPYDTCAICLDWKKYREGIATFDPKKHATPGHAALAFHRTTQKQVKNAEGKLEWVGKGLIRGLSVTRKDYCEHAKTQMNRILPDGRKVFVYNDYPKFFDISFVFIGADRTAKVMMKVAGAGRVYSFGSSVKEAEANGITSETIDEGEKTASVEDELLKLAFGKSARLHKKSEIVKEVVPSQFAGGVVKSMAPVEDDLPKDLLNTLGKRDLHESLATSGGLGIVLKPREFQRVVLIQIGRGDLADDYEDRNVVFSRSRDYTPMPLSRGNFASDLAKLLLPFMGARSALAPAIEHRALVLSGSGKEKKSSASSQPSELLRKIGAAYNGYRTTLMDLVTNSQSLLKTAAPQGSDLQKLASAEADQLFTALSVHYLRDAFWEETGSDPYGGLL